MDVKKHFGGAASIAAVVAFFAFGGWVSWHFLVGGFGSGTSVVPVVIATGGHSWKRQLPLIAVTKETQSPLRPWLISTGLKNPIQAIRPPLIDLPRPARVSLLPLIATGIARTVVASRPVSPALIELSDIRHATSIGITASVAGQLPAIQFSAADFAAPPPARIAKTGPPPTPAAIDIGPGDRVAPGLIDLAPAAAQASATSVPPVSLIDLHTIAVRPSAERITDISNGLAESTQSIQYDTDILDPGQQQRRYVEAICTDHQGNLWVGCEDTGVWRSTGGSRRVWTQFTTKDGLGDDNCYALACDRQGRIWAGSGGSGTGRGTR